MNTVNASTGFMPFQLHFGKSPQILPPITCQNPDTDEATTNTNEIMHHMQAMEMEAQDHLIEAKTSQASVVNAYHDLSFPFTVGDWVMLSTMHCRHEYKSTDLRCTTKFMPHFDGPYHIVATDEKHSTVTLDLPDNPQMFLVFHTFKVKHFNELFPDHALYPPDPVMINGCEEFFIIKSSIKGAGDEAYNTESGGKEKGLKVTSGSQPESLKTARPLTNGKTIKA